MKRLNTILVICFLVVFCIPSMVAQNTTKKQITKIVLRRFIIVVG